MEKNVRSIETDGLVWGASKIEPVAFGINKLQVFLILKGDRRVPCVLSKSLFYLLYPTRA